MVSRSDVIEAYQLVLGREPECEEVIQDHMAARAVSDLYRSLLKSDEFQEIRHAGRKPRWSPKESAGMGEGHAGERRAGQPVAQPSRLAGFLEGNVFAAKGFAHGGEVVRTLSFFDAVQREEGLRGHIGEIGVAGGAFFVPLALCCRDDEIAVAIDVFDRTELNWDPAGGTSSLAKFKQIILDIIGTDEQVKYIVADSFFLEPAAVRLAAGGEGFRLFSIDGAHSSHHTVSDLRLAGELINPGGIVLLDDIQNWGWPGVMTGFARYMLLNDQQRLVPFFLYRNKLLLTTPGDQEFYLGKTVELADLYGLSAEADDYRIAEFFGFRVMGW